MKYTYRTVNGKEVVFKITAEENMKLTKDRTFFTNEVYLSLNDSPENYEEVGYEVWKYFITDEVPSNKVEELIKEIEQLKQTNILLEELLLDTDYRLTCIELSKIDDEE